MTQASPARLLGFVDGPNELLVAATDPSSFNADIYGPANPAAPSLLMATAYIGAVQNSADTRLQGWTCNSSCAVFGTDLTCEDPPL
jgi:hypothetical protein